MIEPASGPRTARSFGRAPRASLTIDSSARAAAQFRPRTEGVAHHRFLREGGSTRCEPPLPSRSVCATGCPGPRFGAAGDRPVCSWSLGQSEGVLSRTLRGQARRCHAGWERRSEEGVGEELGRVLVGDPIAPSDPGRRGQGGHAVRRPAAAIRPGRARTGSGEHAHTTRSRRRRRSALLVAERRTALYPNSNGREAATLITVFAALPTTSTSARDRAIPR